VFRLVVKKMLLSKAYLELKKKSYPVFTLFVEKYLEENYPGWYEYLAKSACPICRTLIPDPKQLYYHLTNRSRCVEALEEIVTEIMVEYDRFYKGVCALHYRKHKNQLLAWLSTHGLRKTVELCKESARVKNAT
jgi:hypothetical protein